MDEKLLEEIEAKMEACDKIDDLLRRKYAEIDDLMLKLRALLESSKSDSQL